MKYWTGCSGWQYPEWKGQFYPADLPKEKWLSYYIEKFNTVEINNTFYQFPTEKSLQRWRAAAPDNFRYSLKAPRSITHYHRFQNVDQILNDFYQLTNILGSTLGCILFQLPKNIQYNIDLLKKIISTLSTDKINALEFRHASWRREDVINLLTNNNIIFVNVNSPMTHHEFISTGKTCYLRFHGQYEWYKGLYGEKFLKVWFTTIIKHSVEEVWCYFDNTMDRSAITDAKIWQEITAQVK